MYRVLNQISQLTLLRLQSFESATPLVLHSHALDRFIKSRPSPKCSVRCSITHLSPWLPRQSSWCATQRDSFTRRHSNVKTVNLNIAAVNDAPNATNDSYFIASNGCLTVAAGEGVLANDSDQDSANLTAAMVSQPANGTVTLNANGSFTYTPQAGFVGLDVFTYRANDGSLDSNLASVAITVTAATNSAPEAGNDSYTLTEETTLTRTAVIGVLTNDTDADGNPLTASLVY
jgi:VCBS repeat-containing protein